MSIFKTIDQIIDTEQIFSNYKIKLALVLGLIYGIQIQYVSAVSFGFLLSILLFLFLLFLILKKYEYGFFVLIHFIIITPVYPRNLSLFLTNDISFHTIFHDKFFGITLIQFLLLTTLIKGIYVSHKEKFSFNIYKTHILLFLLFVLVFFVGLVFNISNSLPSIFIRKIISDFQFPILIIAGFITGIALTHTTTNFIKKLINILIFSFIVAAFRALNFFVFDIIDGNFNIYFGENAGLILPIFFLLFLIKFDNQRSGYFVLFISGLIILPKGRADIFFLFLLFFIVFLIRWKYLEPEPEYYFGKKIVLLLASYFVAFVGLTIYANDIIMFISYKFYFFTSEIFSNLSASPGIRIIEFVNILKKNIDDGVIGILFGQGAGGTFNFFYAPMTYVIKQSAYSVNELSSNVFFSPHTFVNFFLLKSGFVGLGGYVTIMLLFFKNTLKLKNTVLKYYLLFNVPIMFWKSFSLPTLTFYLGILFALSIFYSQQLKAKP